MTSCSDECSADMASSVAAAGRQGTAVGADHSVFSRFIETARARGALVVQPRMGWGAPAAMRRGLEAVKGGSPNWLGTITLDSYTRVGDYRSPLVCLRDGHDLNGYPIVSHPVSTTKTLLDGVRDERFPVQVRHGTAQPQAIFRRMVDVGLDATEGGPVSYCLPYGRIHLPTAIQAWRESCRMLACETAYGHIESFGGCLMGQLCPPSLLVVVSLMECLFFRENGIRSTSLSYAQGTSLIQDRAALRVMRELAATHLQGMNWHVVLYTYMGLFPATESGANRLIADSARLARETGCARLIVKTRAERRQIPSLDDNIHALRTAEAAAANALPADLLSQEEATCYQRIREEVLSLLEVALNLDAHLSHALLKAFERGVLDVPYCLHPDNRGATRCGIDEQGHLCWTATGNLPLSKGQLERKSRQSAADLLTQLSYVADLYDGTRS